jgi:hypothetical protein
MRHGGVGSAGKNISWPLYCLEALDFTHAFFVSLGLVMSYGAAHFENVSLLTMTQHGTPTNRKKSSAAARPSEAAKRVRESPQATAIQLASTPKKAKRSAAAMPSAAEKRGSGVSPDYGNPTRTHPEKDQAEHIGKAKCSEKGGGSGVSPGYDTTQHAHAQKKAKRSGEAEERVEGGFEGLS